MQTVAERSRRTCPDEVNLPTSIFLRCIPGVTSCRHNYNSWRQNVELNSYGRLCQLVNTEGARSVYDLLLSAAGQILQVIMTLLQQTHTWIGYLYNIRRQLGKAIDSGNEIVSLDLLLERGEASNDQYKPILPMILLMDTENGLGSV